MLELFKAGNGAVGFKKLWYIYTAEYYSAPNRNGLLPFVTAWMDPEGVVLSEISQSNKHDFTYTWNLKSNVNKHTNLKWTYRYREQTGGVVARGVRGWRTG